MRLEPCCCVKVNDNATVEKNPVGGCLYKLMKSCFAPVLFSNWIRPIVVSSVISVNLYCFNLLLYFKFELNLHMFTLLCYVIV